MERSTCLFAATVMLCLAFLGSFTQDLNAQTIEIPRYLSYQGVLTDQNREQVPNGPYTITFKIYDTEKGGTPLWLETQIVQTIDGVFDAYLGITSPLDLAFNNQYWIAAQVQGEGEMEPRTRIVPTAYAFTAGHAAIADDLSGDYVKTINGQTGDVVIGDPSLSDGSLWIGDVNNKPSELPLGSANQVMTVKPDGTTAEWSSNLRLATIDVRSISTDSLFVRMYANFGGPTVFNDSVVFNGHVTLKFPPDNRLTYKAVAVGDEQNEASELLTTNQPGAILMQDANGAPSYSSDLNVNNVTINGTTNIQGSTTNIQSDNITIGPVTSTTTFEGKTIFNISPDIALPEGWIWRGGSSGYQEPYAPGSNGDVLTVIDGVPQWMATGGGYLPLGTTPNSTLIWNGTKWVENIYLKSNPVNGNTTIGGSLAVTGPSVDLPAGSVDNVELANSTFNVTYGQGVSGSPQVSLGSTLNIQNTGVIAVNGTPNQVNVSATSGSVTLSTPQDIHTGATPTFIGMSLTGLLGGSSATNVLVSNGGQIETRTATSLFTDVTLTTGSIWYGDAGNNPTELAPGTNGQVLTTVGGSPMWRSINVADFDLSENAIWIGDASNKAAELSGGTPGQALRVSATGAPVWENVNELPTGTTVNAPLIWNGTTWVEATNVTINPTNGDITTNGDVTTNGDLTVNGSIDLPLTQDNIFVGDASNRTSELAPGTDGQVLRINGSTPTWETMNGTDLSLTNKSILVGDATNNASELPTTNVTGALLQQDAAGNPVWSNDLVVNNVTVNGDQINNGDVNFNGPTFNTSTTTTSTFNGPTNLNGSTTTINSPLTEINSSTINIGGPTSTTTFDGDVIFNMLPNLPLAPNYLYMGGASGYAEQFAPGTTGQTLRVNGSGAPSWQDVNELPNGSTTNATLVWNGTAWVENTNVTMNPANGNTVIGGDLTVNGSFTGAGANKFAGAVAIPFGVSQVSIPYAGIKTGAVVNVNVMDNDANIGIISTRVVSVTQGVGFTVQLSINYDSSTGILHYVVVNP